VSYKYQITHSEWASSDAFSASAGSGLSKPSTGGTPFKRLPFNFCAVSLQPFHTPVCAPNGTIFDIDHILPWLLKHGTNPINGETLKSTDLVKLHFAKNDDGEMVDPVTYKVFTNNTHIVALANTGNVFAWETVERLNIKAKMWRDLVSDAEFSRKDIITLQDPQNLSGRNLSEFKYLKDGTSTLTPVQQRERNDPSRNVNRSALGNGAEILPQPKNAAPFATTKPSTTVSKKPQPPSSTTTAILPPSKPTAAHTTGRTAASFTSTGLTPHTTTTSDLALLTDEAYLLHRRRVKLPGYATLRTTLGTLSLELYPEFAPLAVWNFLTLAKRGYYTGVPFHRNVRAFMIQGGDPTGTGKGGQSCWGRGFKDEVDGPRSFKEGRGVLAMANKGKDTNGSQFFIVYRPAKHLDRKHTIFGKVVGGMETLDKIEAAEVGKGDRPLEEIRIEEVAVLVDPFEAFMASKKEKEQDEEVRREVERKGGREDDRTTWTGKRVRGVVGGMEGGMGGGRRGDGVGEEEDRSLGVGKYLRANEGEGGGGAGGGEGGGKTVGDVREEWEAEEQPVRKKIRGGGRGGFGNFEGW